MALAADQAEVRTVIRLLAWLGFFPLVWTKDHDGEIRLRLVKSRSRKPDVFGEGAQPLTLIVRGIPGQSQFSLNRDGTCAPWSGGGSYVTKWREWEHNRKHVTFPASGKIAAHAQESSEEGGEASSG